MPRSLTSIVNDLAKMGFDPTKPPEEVEKYEEEALNFMLRHRSAGIGTPIHEWLIKQGLLPNAVKTASPRSLAKAFAKKSYLKAWRANSNPNWSLLDKEDDENDENEDRAKAEAQTQASAQAQAPAPALTNAGTEIKPSEAWLTALFAQVEKAVEKIVAQSTIKIDPAAGEKIKALAREAAQAEILAQAKPKTIQILREANSKRETKNLGRQHFKFPTLLRAAQARNSDGFRLNIWLTGPTGSGKTTSARKVAEALNLPFGSDGSLDADYKVLGFRNAQGEVVSTQFLDIYSKGGVYIADEIDNWLPSALLALNAALANGFVASPSGLIHRHPDAIIIACANTWGLGATNDYVGRNKLDAASLDRFHPKIDWPIDPQLEGALAYDAAGEVGELWHKIILAARSNAKTRGLKIIVSPRATFNGLALLTAGFGTREIVSMTFGAGLTPEQETNLFGTWLEPKAAALDAALKRAAQSLTLGESPAATSAPDLAFASALDLILSEMS